MNIKSVVCYPLLHQIAIGLVISNIRIQDCFINTIVDKNVVTSREINWPSISNVANPVGSHKATTTHQLGCFQQLTRPITHQLARYCIPLAFREQEGDRKLRAIGLALVHPVADVVEVGSGFGIAAHLIGAGQANDSRAWGQSAVIGHIGALAFG